MNTIVTFIIAHEDFSSALLHTVEKILGPQKGVFTFSNQQDALPVLSRKILKLLKEQQVEKVVIFVDLKGGSCWNLAGMLCHEHPQAVAIAGVNVPMLVSYFHYRDELPFSDLIDKVILDGSQGISRLEG
jgi:mannose/fructose-specific phosphotransferase system component IIA